MTNSPMIYPYARISTLTQLSGTGLDLQTDQEQLELLSTKYNLPIADGIQDLGKSVKWSSKIGHSFRAN